MTCPLAINYIQISPSLRIAFETPHYVVLPDNTAGTIHFVDQHGKVTNRRFFLDFNGDKTLVNLIGNNPAALTELQLTIGNKISEEFNKLAKPGMVIKHLYSTTRSAFYERYK